MYGMYDFTVGTNVYRIAEPFSDHTYNENYVLYGNGKAIKAFRTYDEAKDHFNKITDFGTV